MIDNNFVWDIISIRLRLKIIIKMNRWYYLVIIIIIINNKFIISIIITIK